MTKQMVQALDSLFDEHQDAPNHNEYVIHAPKPTCDLDIDISALCHKKHGKKNKKGKFNKDWDL